MDVGHISRRVFDINPQYFTLILTNLINDSLEGGYFPDSFKLSKVVPVFKKGCRFQLNSYRPISIASLVCKLYEKLVLLQITKFLNDNNLLCPDQFDFVQASNTEIAFIHLIKHITDN